MDQLCGYGGVPGTGDDGDIVLHREATKFVREFGFASQNEGTDGFFEGDPLNFLAISHDDDEGGGVEFFHSSFQAFFRGGTDQ